MAQTAALSADQKDYQLINRNRVTLKPTSVLYKAIDIDFIVQVKKQYDSIF